MTLLIQPDKEKAHSQDASYKQTQTKENIHRIPTPPVYKLHLEAKLPVFGIFITPLHTLWCSCFLLDLS